MGLLSALPTSFSPMSPRPQFLPLADDLKTTAYDDSLQPLPLPFCYITVLGEAVAAPLIS